jgi:hypothetical protein
MKKYLLTGYFDSFEHGIVSQGIADTNNFEVIQTLLENLMSWGIDMDILDTETNEIILRTRDYDPPKQEKTNK